MKKLFALLAVAFGVMSCQTDVNDFGANVGGEQDVNILVSLPEATRANSALGAFENVDMTKYDIRYIFQVFNADGTANKAMQYVYSDETTVTFPVRLIAGREYNFAVWADLVENGKEKNDNYTIGETLKDISLKDWAPMDETRDAYTGKWSGEFSGAQGITIPLTRPFAKLRVVTTDMKELLGVEPTTAMVKYTTNYYAKFNAFDQAPESATSTKTHETFTIASYDETGAKKTLFADYIFATEQQETVNFELSVLDQADAIIGEVKSFTTAIPVKRNNLTTIEGNILTVGDDITVKVDDAFAVENIIIEGEYTLTADMVVDRPIVVLAGTEAVIDLNNFNIINTTASETFGEGEGIIAYGNLTIKGEGTVKGNTMAVWARGNNNATITIEGGNFEGCAEGYAKGGRSVVYASSGNVINIYGGTFKALAADKSSYADKTNGVYAAINVADNNGMINVYGGSFYKQNPAAPGTEPKAWNEAHPNGFLAEGYIAEADGDWFEVSYDPYYGYTKVSDVAGLKTALTDNSVEKIYLAAGEYDLNDKIYYLETKKLLTAEADAKPLVKGKFVAVNADLTATNIKFGRNSMSDVNLEGKTYGTYVVGSYNAMITLHYAAGTFENCEFNGEESVVAINYFMDAAGKVLNVNNCTFQNTYIYSKVLCNITNNTFNLGGIPYGLCVWPRAAGSTNSICYFVNNTLNSVYVAPDLAYCQVMLLSQSAPYANLEFNIQGNSGSKYTVGWTNSVVFKNDGSVTFADGSKTFSFPKLVD